MTPILGQATDIAGVLTTLNTYVPVAVGIAIALLLFTLGRKVVKRYV